MATLKTKAGGRLALNVMRKKYTMAKMKAATPAVMGLCINEPKLNIYTLSNKKNSHIDNLPDPTYITLQNYMAYFAFMEI